MHTPKVGAGTPAQIDRIRGAVHATWVVEDKKTKTFTTHDAIGGYSLQTCKRYPYPSNKNF